MYIFKGIESMKEFKSGIEVELLTMPDEKQITSSGMCFISHPEGYYSEYHGKTVLMVNYKEHLEKVKE